MKNSTIHILWDNSRLWGLMAWRSLRGLGASPQLVLAEKIAQGLLLCKHVRLLLVPGGSARQKALALGPAGLEAIRQYLRQGGTYLGFCGGAGMALSQDNPALGLGICPWQRGNYEDRLYHLVSGPLIAEIDGKCLELPVWWPGKFAENEGNNLKILARYLAPGNDLWLADLPLMQAPAEILTQWRRDGNLDSALSLKKGQPLIVAGHYGKGKYILSYVHLETPASADANSYLARLLRDLLQNDLAANFVQPWQPDLSTCNAAWGDELHVGLRHLRGLLATGKKLGLFFERMPWLLGWRRGAPGMACNNLLACLATLACLEPTEQALDFWQGMKKNFAVALETFVAQGSQWLWDWQLAHTLDSGADRRHELETGRNAIFGHPMLGGGKLDGLLQTLDKLIYLCQEEEDDDKTLY